MISNSVYKAKNSKSIHHISIIASDHYTARCRCSKNIFKSIGMNVRIGSILHIRIKMNYSIPKDENPISFPDVSKCSKRTGNWATCSFEIRMESSLPALDTKEASWTKL